ncbi:MAG: UDP-N-acetylmuramoyl-L-alanyl-D-glutamate--2,6-diaminopimelate ligase [Solirubrobacterales bacterium]|nr:UDP-N-acetylmuramoyl-L-alanyl-D-glutamate--2,6-diaminopimelate ligase [Solirubrobacterales bacterium]
MLLGELFEDPSLPPVEVSSLAFSDAAVEPGALFFCVVGSRDGHAFAPAAVAKGAAALVVERELDLSVPQVVVQSSRAAMAPVAARFFGDPTATLRVAGITGTNGKTTSAFLLRSVLEAAGIRTGLLGTVASVIAGVEEPAIRTTPEAIDLQRTFRRMLDGGDAACAMEVSSHALKLHRADAIHWAVAVFTNLTQDHLDFHTDMEDYFQAKRLLFARADAQGTPLVANADDPWGARLAREFPRTVTFGIEAAGASLRATDLRPAAAHTDFRLGGLELRAPLPGRFNVLNVLGVVAAARALGVTDEAIAAALPEAARVPGRFEPVEEGQEFAVVVDYSHTPDSLENVLRAARELAAGRVLVVFGAGGDRDREKRPLMGRAAAELADVAVITSDNPRNEDPAAILAEIAEGAGGPAEVTRVLDRREAIAHAIGQARAGDVVVIAGKGHETYQELAGGERVPFDDREVAREALRARLVA